MTKDANSEKFLSEDQLQDINGGCNHCDQLVEAHNGFNQQGDWLHAKADNIHQANMPAQDITNEEQALRDKAVTSYRNAGFVKDAISSIGHFTIK